MKKIYHKITLAVIFIIVFTQLFYTGVLAETADNSDYLNSVREMIKELYNGQIDEKALMTDSLKTMFSTMDPYTAFYTPQEAKDFLEDIEGNFEGIGVAMEKVGDYLVITRVYSGTPAAKAGLKPGDFILAAGGKNLIGASSEEASGLIKGAAGTRVNLEIKRDGSSTPLKVEVIRAKIKVNPVSYDLINDIGYIKLDIFNMNSAPAIRQALDEMDKRNITRIILDLRDNPGGEVNAAIGIAQNFVPKGLVTKLDYKSETLEDESYYSDLEKLKYRLVVLVNSKSASASEILAGAIQDKGSGTLMGTKTFGKAKVQHLYPLLTPEAYEKYSIQTGIRTVNAYDLSDYDISPSEDEIIGWTKITTGFYYTPGGRMIDGKGLTPDITTDDPKLAGGIDVRSLGKLGKTSQPGLNSVSSEVYNAEKILKAKGYNIAAPDTILDSRTFEAIRKYQRNCSIKSSGILNYQTQEFLNKTRQNLIMQYDRQYARAVELLSK